MMLEIVLNANQDLILIYKVIATCYQLTAAELMLMVFVLHVIQDFSLIN